MSSLVGLYCSRWENISLYIVLGRMEYRHFTCNGYKMTHEEEQKFIANIDRAADSEQRIAAALERLADYFAPQKAQRTGRSAVLSTATYKRDVETEKPPRGTPTTVRGG